MNKLKKLLALVLALAICATFALPALSADDDGYSLTMKNPQPEHLYTIYQIFTGTVSTDDHTLSDIDWGSAFSSKPDDNAKDVAEGLTTAVEMENYLNGLTLENLTPYSQEGLNNPQNGVNSNTPLTWNGLPGGYYMIVDDKGDTDTPASRIMAIIVGNAEVTTKPDEPTLEKKVAKLKEDGTPEWKDAITAALGETYQFELLANINKANLKRFVDRPEEGKAPSYPLTFKDTLTGMTYENITSVKILNADKTDHKTIDVPNYTITPADDNKSFTLAIDLLTEGVLGTNSSNWPADADFYVEVVYTSKLSDEAIIYPGEGNNINTATLDYKPNPESDQPSTTPPDDAKVFTFEIDGTKVDGDDETTPLKGAVFNIYKLAEGQDKVPDGAKPLMFVKDETGNYVLSDDENASPDVTSAETTGEFNFVGLDAGKFALKEIKAPDGYNLITEDIIIDIIPVYDNEENPTNVTKVTHTQSGVTGEDGSLTVTDGTEITVLNFSGSTLPSTGGIGTTIFYIVGAVLVVGAGVLLFTKRRAKG